VIRATLRFELGSYVSVMSRPRVVLLLFFLGSCAHSVALDHQAPATMGLEPGGYEEAEVVHVVDGDTIRVLLTGRVEGAGAGATQIGETRDVRLLGIDTPETVRPNTPIECFGREASAAAKALLEGQTVRLIDDVENVDGYGRLLRYVYLGEEMANARLVVNGYASVYTYPPNVRHADLFVALQREARKNNRGLWAPDTCNGKD
jgi:micrococcal nuclease